VGGMPDKALKFLEEGAWIADDFNYTSGSEG
jgi:hypothetical protein